ncbi:MAG: hypothetical protein ACYSUP_08950 [Planctomycetota bacterium]|jgi:hypothetical protein
MIEGITGATAAAVGGAAVAAEIGRAIKASGAIVRMESADFETILNKAEDPLVVHCQGKFLATTYQYITAYKGLVFYCKSSTPLMLPHKVEVINAKRIWIPT